MFTKKNWMSVENNVWFFIKKRNMCIVYNNHENETTGKIENKTEQ